MGKNFTDWIGKIIGIGKNKSCCNDCMKVLDLVIDNEANEKEQKYLYDHIEDCLPCFNHYQIEKSVKELVKHRMEKRPVPQSLIDTIRNQIEKNA